MRLFELQRKCLVKNRLIQKYCRNIPMSTLEISKHQSYLKQMVISVESWA